MESMQVSTGWSRGIGGSFFDGAAIWMVPEWSGRLEPLISITSMLREVLVCDSERSLMYRQQPGPRPWPRYIALRPRLPLAQG